MKYFLLIMSLCSMVFGKAIIVEKYTNQQAVSTWTVTSFLNANGSYSIVTYNTLQEAQKAVPILAKDGSGLSKDSDRVTVYLKEDETVDRVDYQVFPTVKSDKGEQVIKASEAKTDTDVSTLVTDIKAKP